MKNNIFYLSVLVFIFTIIFYKSNDLWSIYNNYLNKYTVSAVKSNPRQFDRMKTFRITGLVKRGWGIPTLIKVFPLEDVITRDWVLIIPKTKVFPKESLSPVTFSVRVYGEQHLFDKDILILKEQ